MLFASLRAQRTPAILLVVGLLSAVTPARSSQAAEPKAVNVLMIGNSYTQGTWPQLKGFFDADPRYQLNLKTHTPGGATLRNHLDQSNVAQWIAHPGTEGVDHWDYVVMQEQSLGPSYYQLGWRPDFLTSAQEMSDLVVENSGAEIIYFNTWSRKQGNDVLAKVFDNDPAKMQSYNNSSWKEVAKKYPERSSIAQVGKAWQGVYGQRPEMNLHAGDGSHGSEAGYYLAGAVLFETITGQSSTSSTYQGSLGPDDARFLREVATQVAGGSQTTDSPPDSAIAAGTGRRTPGSTSGGSPAAGSPHAVDPTSGATSLVGESGASTGGTQAPWLAGSTSPNWANARPRRTLPLKFDARKSNEQNGALLAQAIRSLKPGDALLIGPGRYSIAAKFNVDIRGTAQAPIWIVGADPARLPIITRPDARQNVMNVGEGSRTEYVAFRQLEFTGGSTLIRFYDCHHLWLDQCHLHHAGAEGVTTNTRDTSYLFITRNHFHDFTNPGATGEAMYLGANNGKVAMSYSVIAENHVHHCGGRQGDGIELKQGSHHNWICRNHVHDTNYPCILAYGTGGNGVNMIEQNICYRSNDNVMQVQGEAVVRNNLLMAARGAGFASTDHQGKTARLTCTYNTIISKARAANLSSWNGREGMVFANNLLYTDQGDALRFPAGSQGVTVAGNVVWGRVSGVASGFIRGTGLADFADVSWDANHRNATPSKNCPFIGKADAQFTVEVDIQGNKRRSPPTAGAVAAP